MTILRGLFSVTLALLVSAPLALADTPKTPEGNAQADNPHDVNSKDRKTDGTPAASTNAQTEQANTGNPHSNLNKDRKAERVSGEPDSDAAEMDNPDSFMNKENRDALKATPSAALERLHAANLNEIAMGKLAQQNGTARVQDYGKMLERDHADADLKVKALAGKRGLKLAGQPADIADMMAMHQMKAGRQMHGKLAALNGAEFDKAFARMMVDDHRKDIAMVKAWRASSKDAELSSLFDEMLPTLQQHQRAAEQLKLPAAQGRTP